MKSLYVSYSKRFFDLTSCVILLLALSWIFLLIVLLYVLSFQHPILFKQQRIGRNQLPFELVKFRTLKPTSHSLQDRRFWLGDFLRFTSLDELPQLWNVLKGEMSLIGPRPLPMEYLPLFSEDQHQRHTTRPGITGWAQVNGRNSISWNKKFELDVFYVKNVSFLLDVKILVKTLVLIASFKKDTSLEEQKFTGNNHA